jgi:hypothetical protein
MCEKSSTVRWVLFSIMLSRWLFLFVITRIFSIQNILPLSSPFSLAIDVTGCGALWVTLPRQPTDLSWVVGRWWLGSCSWSWLLGTSSRLVLNRAALYWGLPSCLGSSLLDIGTCSVKYKIWFWYLCFKNYLLDSCTCFRCLFCVMYYCWCADIGMKRRIYKQLSLLL